MKKFLANRTGAAAIEMIIIAPVFLILLLGLIEVGRLILVNQKAARASFSIANTLSSSSATLNGTLSSVLDSGGRLFAPFSFENTGQSGIVVTAFNRPAAGATTRAWRCKSQGQVTSNVTDINSIIRLSPGEGVYVIEVFYTYNAIFAPGAYTPFNDANSRLISSRSIIRPREGGLVTATTPNPGGNAQCE